MTVEFLTLISVNLVSEFNAKKAIKGKTDDLRSHVNLKLNHGNVMISRLKGQ